MSEQDSQVSQHILAQLEGEKIRIILIDGRALEGTVRRVEREALHLDVHVIPLKEIANYFVLKKS